MNRIPPQRKLQAGTVIFKYTGVFDWKHIYRECKEFWIRIVADEWDVVESMYKHKPGKLEVKWDVHHNYDAYYQITYNIWFKIIKPRTVFIEKDGKKKEMMQGAVRCWVTFGWQEEFTHETFGGDLKLFQSQWLRNIYRKVTWRERWDLVDDIAMFTANDFFQLLGHLFKTDASEYASIWEPG